MTETLIYAADVTALSDAAVFEKGYAAVSAERREKIDLCRRDADKRLSLGAALLLRRALSDCGLDPDCDIVRGEHGKPYIPGGAFFNLSHSGKIAVCALSPFEVGCDVQEMTAVRERVAKRFFAPEEYAHVSSAGSEEERLDLFFRYWTLKESFLKVTGRGLSLPLGSFRIVLGGDISVIHSVDDREYRFFEYPTDGYRCALCVAGECGKPGFREIDLK